MLYVGDDSNDDRIRLGSVGAADVVAERCAGCAEEVPREAGIDDSDFLGCRSIGGAEVAPCKKRNSKRLEIVIADPGKLHVEFFVGFGRVAADGDVSATTIAGKIGIIRRAHPANAGKTRDGIENALFNGRDLRGRVSGEFRREIELEQMIGREAGVDVAQVLNGTDKEARADDEDETESDLQGDPGAAQLEPTAAAGSGLWRVLLFTIAATLIASLLFSLAPAMQFHNPRLTDALKQHRAWQKIPARPAILRTSSV